MQNPTPRLAAIYVREPAPGTRGIESSQAQRERCQKFCMAEGIDTVRHYGDGPGQREAFQNMMNEACREGADYDLIVVSHLDRFSGSLEETIDCRDRLELRGVRLVSATQKVVGT